MRPLLPTLAAATALPLVLAACAPSLRPVDERLLQCAAERRDGPAPSGERLSEGRRLYASRCKGCHALVPPDQVPAERWPRLVEEMASEAHPPLDEREQAAVLAYLQAASRCP